MRFPAVIMAAACLSSLPFMVSCAKSLKDTRADKTLSALQAIPTRHQVKRALGYDPIMEFALSLRTSLGPNTPLLVAVYSMEPPVGYELELEEPAPVYPPYFDERSALYAPRPENLVYVFDDEKVVLSRILAEMVDSPNPLEKEIYAQVMQRMPY